jgi:hypothetical protein
VPLEVRRRHRDVAQRRHFECAAEIACGGEIVAERPAQPEIEIGRIVVRRNRCVARHAEVVITEIGEQRRFAARAAPTRMARRAIAFERIVEERQTALLDGVSCVLPARK